MWLFSSADDSCVDQPFSRCFCIESTGNVTLFGLDKLINFIWASVKAKTLNVVALAHPEVNPGLHCPWIQSRYEKNQREDMTVQEQGRYVVRRYRSLLIYAQGIVVCAFNEPRLVLVLASPFFSTLSFYLVSAQPQLLLLHDVWSTFKSAAWKWTKAKECVNIFYIPSPSNQSPLAVLVWKGRVSSCQCWAPQQQQERHPGGSSAEWQRFRSRSGSWRQLTAAHGAPGRGAAWGWRLILYFLMCTWLFWTISDYFTGEHNWEGCPAGK